METSPINNTTVRLRPVPIPSWFRTGLQVASAVAPSAAARWAGKLCFTPPKARLRPEEAQVLDRAERFSFEVRGRRLAGWAWGAGPVVLLVHGWGGHAGQMTSLVAPIVEAGFRAIAVDFPAHGQSEGHTSSLVHFADAMAHVEGLFGPLRGLVAHSFGAAGSTWALSRGLQVSRVVFIAAPARFDPFWARFRQGAGISEPIWAETVRQAEQWLGVRFQGIAPVELAPRMTAPLLILHDRQDGEVLFEEAELLAGAWSDAQLCASERLGHMRILRDAGTAQKVVRFLEG